MRNVIKPKEEEDPEVGELKIEEKDIPYITKTPCPCGKSASERLVNTKYNKWEEYYPGSFRNSRGHFVEKGCYYPGVYEVKPCTVPVGTETARKQALAELDAIFLLLKLSPEALNNVLNVAFR